MTPLTPATADAVTYDHDRPIGPLLEAATTAGGTTDLEYLDDFDRRLHGQFENDGGDQ